MGSVQVEIRDAVAIMTITNPPVNVLSVEIGRLLSEAVDALAMADDVLAVIVTGAGNKAFMAGADIKEFPQYIADQTGEMMALAFDDAMTRLHRLHKPTIAALNGVTLGGGCELALACDFRIAEEQVIIGLPEVKLGLFPGAGGTQRLPRLIGASRAKELILTGEPISAAEAYRIGLVNRVVPQGEAVSAALEFAGLFRQRSRVAVARAKQAIDDGLERDLDSGLRLEAKLFGEAFGTEDVREGVTAFMEKRAPVWHHR